MIAHVGGVPIEEMVLPWLSGMGAGLLLARTWIVSRVKRSRRSRSDPAQGVARPDPADTAKAELLMGFRRTR